MLDCMDAINISYNNEVSLIFAHFLIKYVVDTVNYFV